MDILDVLFGSVGCDHLHSSDDEDGSEYDSDYNALNDETFGSAAVGGDWEESHKEFSSQTDAERSRIKNNALQGSSQIDECYSLTTPHKNEKSFDNSSYDKPRLFERNVILGELSSSPGNSIWTPTQSLNTNDQKCNSDLHLPLSQFQNLSAQSNVLNNTQLLNGFHNTNIAPPPGLPKQVTSFKTVEEIELELKRQHSTHLFFDQVNKTKPAAMTVEDLERMNLNPSLQTNVNMPNAQSVNSHPRQSQQLQFPNARHSGTGIAIPRPNHMMPPHQQNIGVNHLGYRPFGNKRPGMPFHPILNPHGNRPRPPPPGMINNMGHHMQNGNIPHRPMMPFNPPRPQPRNMGDIFKNFYMNGNQPNNPNFIQNGSGLERRNFEQNMRFEHMRNNHYERDQNNGHSNDMSSRTRRDSDNEWEEWHRIRQLDEYAGLMTPREKNWLRNIQGMQLQTENPYQDDYYYIMHNAKHERKCDEELIELDGLQMLLLDKGKEGKEYEPPKLENSLGKLQVASVNAPRKIIDLEVVHLDSSHPTTSLQRDMRKHRTLLMRVEKMYDTMIELDDLQRKIRALPDCPTRDSFRSKCRQLVTKLWNDLINPHETFVQILCIKKGKTLSARLMIWIGESEVEHLLATVIQNLSLLSKKDGNDKRLPLFWPIADRFFATRNAPSIASFGIMMGSQLKVQKNLFIPALENKLGLSMVLALLVRGENLWSELKDDEAWMQFVTDAVTAFSCKSSENILEPLLSITLAASPRHPSTHILRSTKVDISTMQKASLVLKVIENYLLKNTPTKP